MHWSHSRAQRHDRLPGGQYHCACSLPTRARFSHHHMRVHHIPYHAQSRTAHPQIHSLLHHAHSIHRMHCAGTVVVSLCSLCRMSLGKGSTPPRQWGLADRASATCRLLTRIGVAPDLECTPLSQSPVDLAPTSRLPHPTVAFPRHTVCGMWTACFAARWRWLTAI